MLDEAHHGFGLLDAIKPQFRRDTFAIWLKSIMTAFLLAFKPGDIELNSDNAAKHDLDVLFRRITECPEPARPMLLLIAQFGNVRLQLLGIAHNSALTVNVHRCVVSRRCDFAVFGFRWILARMNIALPPE